MLSTGLHRILSWMVNQTEWWKEVGTQPSQTNKKRNFRFHFLQLLNELGSINTVRSEGHEFLELLQTRIKQALDCFRRKDLQLWQLCSNRKKGSHVIPAALIVALCVESIQVDFQFYSWPHTPTNTRVEKLQAARSIGTVLLFQQRPQKLPTKVPRGIVARVLIDTVPCERQEGFLRQTELACNQHPMVPAVEITLVRLEHPFAKHDFPLCQ